MSARFVICEKTGRWAAALRWACGASPMQIYETRSLLDCRQELLRCPSCFVALEVNPANIEGVFRLLSEIHDSFPDSRAVVLASRDVAAWEDTLREAGALHVVFSPRRLDLIVQIARRYATDMPRPEHSLREIIWSRLPWSEG